MKNTPSLFDLVGGTAGAHQLAERFYARVLLDPKLRPLFRDPTEPHAARMGDFLAEFFGGPRVHSQTRGGFAQMVRAHQGLGIAEEQRARWVEHMHGAMTELQLPAPFFEAFSEYLHRGSRLAMQNSQ
jgi:hemoglobin